MGITCKPMGKMKRIMKRMENVVNKEEAALKKKKIKSDDKEKMLWNQLLYMQMSKMVM